MQTALQTASPTFHLDHAWFRLPDGFPLGDCHGLAVDQRNHVFLLQQNGDPTLPAVLEFDSSGRHVGGWGGRFARGAHGLAIDRRDGAEHLYVVDYELATVVKCTLDGKEILELPKPVHAAYPNGHGYKPTDVAIAPNGDIYVTDGYGQSLIHRYDREGRYRQTIGWKGNGPGQFDCPHGICIDARGPEPVLLVADRANVRVQVLSLDGAHRQTITSRGLRYPCTVRVQGDQTLIPDLFGAVLVWDREYRHVATIGAHPDMRPGEWPRHVAGYPNVPREDRIAGRFISPHGIAADSTGNIYVAEWLRDGGRLTRITKA
jgi:DNA-binding beta-propeller fold protein YncE